MLGRFLFSAFTWGLIYSIIGNFIPASRGAPLFAANSKFVKEDREYGFLYRLEDVVVNLRKNKKYRFLVMNIALEVKEKEDVERLRECEASLRNSITKLVSSKKVEELDDSKDKQRLRKEIKRKVAAYLPEGHLYTVHFANYIIQ